MRRAWLSIPCAILIAACGATGSAPSATPVPPQPAPALIQVENISFARPQSGLGAAGIVYEYVTEGGISRFSVIYLHPPSERIGPVRSARLVTISLAKHYGAVLIYSGAGTYVDQQIQQSGVPHFNEDTAHGDLFRAGDRVPPHNLYTDGGHLADLLGRANAPPVAWHLWSRTTHPPATGTPATSFDVPVSSGEVPEWTFDAANGGYTRMEPDTGTFTDAVSGRPVIAPTVIVQQVVVTPAPQVEDVNGVQGVEQNIDSGGAAQVFTGGREYDAAWSQPANGPADFTLKNGSPAPIASGLVWIELVPQGSRANVKP